MKAAAFILVGLCCCATARPGTLLSPPSSLPTLHVDESLDGVRISPAGMRVVLKKRAREKAEHEKQVTELEKDKRVLTMQRDGAENFANRNAFWGMWGPTIAVSSALGGAVITTAVFLVVFFFGGFNGR